MYVLSKAHDWKHFRGGPPSDCDYSWCCLCGTMRVRSAGDPDEYHVPGCVQVMEAEPACVR